MNYTLPFPWPTTRDEAFSILHEMAPHVVISVNAPEPKLIAAVETDYGHTGDTLYGAAVALTFPEFQVIERSVCFEELTFPYHPTLVFFREGQTSINALAKLRSDPDLLMVSGHGLAHPLFCGTASHIGMLFDKPTIGCARRLLAGQHRELAKTKGSSQPIMIGNREVGVAYRSKDGVKPIFISPAHRCDLGFARRITVQCLREFRLPEPLRMAHLDVNSYRRRSEQIGGHGPTARRHQHRENQE
jgi:deoxyribonuclease V